MWPLISGLLRTHSICGNRYTDEEWKFEVEWVEADLHIFHFVVICNARMKDMVMSLRWNTTRHFLPENHLDLNPAGLPCVHIAAFLGRIEVVKRLLLQNPAITNERVGAHQETVLHSAVRGNHMDAIACLMHGFPVVNQDVTDIFGHTPLQRAIKEDHGAATLLYRALRNSERKNMSANDMLCDLIDSMNHRNTDEVRVIAALILNDHDLDWSTRRRSPYIAALFLLRQKLDWLEKMQNKPGQWATPGQYATEWAVMTAVFKLSHMLNRSLVSLRSPLRYYNHHGCLVILLLFQLSPLNFLAAIYKSRDHRLKHRGEYVICSSIDQDGETASDIALRRGPEFQKIAVSWHEDDLEPAVLQCLIDQKDYRQAAELLFVQGRFEEALVYLCKKKASIATGRCA